MTRATFPDFCHSKRMDGSPVRRRVSLPLLLALWTGAGGAHAAGFPTEPSPAVVQPAPPPLPAEPDRWLPFRGFDWRAGLASPVYDLDIDRHGYLWAVNPDGASMYNGHTWKHVDLPTDPPDIEVTELLAANDGSLWFGTRTQGIFRLHGGVWSSFQPGETGPAYPYVQSFVETLHAGRVVIWAATSRGVARCEAETCQPVRDLWGLSTRDLVPTRDGKGRMALWVATENGLVRLDGIETPTPSLASVLFDHRNALPADSVRSLAESVAADGRRSLWVGTDQGLARLREGRWTSYDSRIGFPAMSIAALRPGPWKGREGVWAATFGAGLVRIDEDDGGWEVFGTSSGLPSGYLYTLLTTGSAAEEPMLWIATTGGLARLDRDRWHTIDSRRGLPSDVVLGAGESLFPDGRSTYWIGTDNGSVRLTDHGWEPFIPFSTPQSPVILDAAWSREASGPVFWLSTPQGLFRHARGTWTLARSGLGAYYLETIPASHGDELWTGNGLQVARFADGHWSTFHPGADGLPGREVNGLEWTRSGPDDIALWVGTDEGIARWTGERWQHIDVPCLPHPRVLAMRALADTDGHGWLWLGTPKGAARVRLTGGRLVPETCQSLPAEMHPQLSEQVSQILSDQAGRIYLSSDRGVVRITLPTGDSLRNVRLEMFDTEDGLPGISFTRACFRDRRGRIWSGSSSGIAILDPSSELRRNRTSSPAPLRIERVLVEGRERPHESRLELRPRERRLEIEYALLRYRREHAIHFQTQLLGLEENPSPWTREARVAYDRLPPGDYVFRVWGRDGDGVVSGPAELSFVALPPPWLSPWAFSLYALALLGLVYGASRLRVRTLALRAAHLEALVTERTRDLAEANRRLELASFTDPLTGLNNRRFLTSTIRPDVVQAIRNHREPMGDPGRRDLVVYLLDLDHFKRLNDRAGHDAGDAVLVETARRLRRVVRASDLAVRWGGEEILVVSRWTDRETGAFLAERLLEAVGGEPFRTGADRTSTVTCSLGWAPFPWSAEDPDAVLFEEVLSLADHALYLAKREGRNRGIGVLPGAANVEEVAERILREDAPLHSLEGMQVELVWTPGPPVAADDRTSTVRTPLTPSGSDAMLRGPI
jgi:diguanylate cyclase (GGDEF)-like protein